MRLRSALVSVALVAATPVFAQDTTRFAKAYEVTGVTASLAQDGAEGLYTLTVTATGTVNSGGWRDPQLSPYIYVTPPADGIQVFDLIASPPPSDAIVTWGFVPVTATITGHLAPWVKGVRVQASTNEQEVMIDGLPDDLPDYESRVDKFTTQSEGMPLPWPFPWYTPQLQRAAK